MSDVDQEVFGCNSADLTLSALRWASSEIAWKSNEMSPLAVAEKLVDSVEGECRHVLDFITIIDNMDMESTGWAWLYLLYFTFMLLLFYGS